MAKKMNDEVFESVCQEVEQSTEGLRKICLDHGSSASSFYDFIDNEKDEEKKLIKAERYARARDRQADFLADKMLEVAFDDTADDTPFTGVNHINRDRLKVDTMKFIASKLKPKKYGDKLDLTSDGEKLPTAIPIVLGNGKSYDDLINELKPE
tara:strand:+ start:5523 stop:5981 length:459 start_codon:yes stop_codon:yes gene_type:complete